MLVIIERMRKRISIISSKTRRLQTAIRIEVGLARSLNRSLARSLNRSLARSLDRSLARSLDRFLAGSNILLTRTVVLLLPSARLLPFAHLHNIEPLAHSFS